MTFFISSFTLIAWVGLSLLDCSYHSWFHVLISYLLTN